MIPIRDLNPSRRTPYLTYILIAINVLVFLWQLTLTQMELFSTFRNLAVVPHEYSASPFSPESWLDGLRSMFMHGSFLHIGSNMLYLWVFGDNVEDRFGRVLYLVVYLLTGYAAVWAQVLVNPDSQIPMIGASGAIAGVLGSYIIQYPRAQIRTLIFFFFIFFPVFPAWLVLGFWFVSQLFNGLSSLGVETMSGGVAFFAHIGGFMAGAFLMATFNLFAPPLPPREPQPNLGGFQQRRQSPPTIFGQPSARPQRPSRSAYDLPPMLGDDPPVANGRRYWINQLSQNRGQPITIQTQRGSYFGVVFAMTPQSVTLRDPLGRVMTIPLDDIIALK